MVVICEQCGKAFPKPYKLKCHINAVHLKIKEFSCTICFQAFPNNSKLKYHQYKHSDVRNYNCEECGRTFKTRSDLYQVKVGWTFFYDCLSFQCFAFIFSITKFTIKERYLRAQNVEKSYKNVVPMKSTWRNTSLTTKTYAKSVIVLLRILLDYENIYQ